MKKLLLSLLALSVLGCGEGFDPPHEVRTLRVLAVQKDQPYAAPNSTVNLRMLWHDASPDAEDPDRNIELHWFGGCYNPPGELYYSCYPTLAAAAAGYLRPELMPELVELVAGPIAQGLGMELTDAERARTLVQTMIVGAHGTGDEYALMIPPEDLIIRDAVDPAMPPYGSSFVFFAACAGTLGLADETEEILDGLSTGGPPDMSALMALGEDFPLVCRDSRGELIGPDDFVAGYSQLFVYRGQVDPDTGVTQPRFTNANPVIDGFVFDGHEGCDEVDPGSLAHVWPGGEPRQLEDICLDNTIVVQACEEDGERECPGYEFRPVLRESNAELDSVAEQAYGTSFTEQMWINYYVDRGGLTSAVRLLNDAQQGWNADYGTKFLAPKEPGPARIWAVVHDNRGGVGWVSRTVIVR